MELSNRDINKIRNALATFQATSPEFDKETKFLFSNLISIHGQDLVFKAINKIVRSLKFPTKIKQMFIREVKNCGYGEEEVAPVIQERRRPVRERSRSRERISTEEKELRAKLLEWLKVTFGALLESDLVISSRFGKGVKLVWKAIKHADKLKQVKDLMNDITGGRFIPNWVHNIINRLNKIRNYFQIGAQKEEVRSS